MIKFKTTKQILLDLNKYDNNISKEEIYSLNKNKQWISKDELYKVMDILSYQDKDGDLMISVKLLKKELEQHKKGQLK